MPNSDKVRVVVNGSASEYEYWTEISITSELNTVARSFQIGTTAKLPQSAEDSGAPPQKLASEGVPRCPHCVSIVSRS